MGPNTCSSQEASGVQGVLRVQEMGYGALRESGVLSWIRAWCLCWGQDIPIGQFPVHGVTQAAWRKPLVGGPHLLFSFQNASWGSCLATSPLLPRPSHPSSLRSALAPSVSPEPLLPLQPPPLLLKDHFPSSWNILPPSSNSATQHSSQSTPCPTPQVTPTLVHMAEANTGWVGRSEPSH